MNIKHPTRLIAVIAAASLLGLAGPAASAVAPTAAPEPASVITEEPGDDAACTIVVKPERTKKNGQVVPAKVRIDPACKQALLQEREAAREARQAAVEERQETREEAREERVELREQVRVEGGSWGAVVRQQTLIRVATKLAERHEQAPTSAALGSILTLINSGVPEALQFDIEAFLAEYELIFADLIKPTDDEDEDDVEPSPSPTT